jgi:large subunit ribosomal protein L1
MSFKEALEKLRKESKERKFKQTVDLIVNLKGIDLRKDNVALVINIPHKVKEKKVCGFLTKKCDLVTTITKPEFTKYKEADKLRVLINEFDFFIAHASLMPSVATTFGKALGPAGKMPSPQLGIVTQETPEVINPLLEKISKSIKVRLKEASIKVGVGKEDMKDEDILANVEAVYKAIVNALPTKRENVKNVTLKFTMSKPVEAKGI